MFKEELTAVSAVELEVLSNTQLWASFWVSGEASSSYWQNQPAIPGANELHSWSLLSVEDNPSTGERRKHRNHTKWWRLWTKCSHPSVWISPARQFDQCRFSDCPKGLLFFHFCLSVWHVFLHGWRLPHRTDIFLLPPSSHTLYISMNSHKLHEVFSSEKNYLDLKIKSGGRDKDEEQIPGCGVPAHLGSPTFRLRCTDMAG